MSNSKEYSQLTDKEKIEIINRLHHDEKKSLSQIAKDFKTYTNKIRRDAKRLGVEIKDKATVLKDLYETGQLVAEHTELTDEQKKKISVAQSKNWAENKEERSKISAKNIKNVVKDKSFEKKRIEGFLKAAEDGSKIELFIRDYLIQNGYYVEYHKEQLLKREKLHIDILLPKIKVAMEIDGITHYEPVFGQDRLNKTQTRDNIKNALLLSMGYVVIHVRIAKKRSNSYFDKVGKAVVSLIKDIEAEFPAKEKRLITLEIKE